MLGEQSRLGGAGALPVQRRVEFEELPRSAVADRGFRLGERAKMERENVGAQENVLRLGKVAKGVESSTKQSLATAVIEKNMNALEILCHANQGPKTNLPPESMKKIYWRSNTTRSAAVQYFHPWKRVRRCEDGCSNEGELCAFGCCSLDDLATHFE